MKIGKEDYDVIDCVCFGIIGLLVIGLVALIAAAVFDAAQSASFQRSAVGEPYQALVEQLGTPTDREEFQSGTTVLCWRKYHEATYSTVLVGKVPVSQYHPAYISGWKAVMKGGKCISMEPL